MTKEQKWRNLRPDKKNKILKKCCRPVRKIRSLVRGLYAVVTAVDQREKAQILDYSPHSLIKAQSKFLREKPDYCGYRRTRTAERGNKSDNNCRN